jgi:hypothetical protein
LADSKAFSLIQFSLDHQETIDHFCATHLCHPYPPRPNCALLYNVFDSTDTIIQDSPSLFVLEAWKTLLQPYPGDLGYTINGIITYGCRLGFKGPPTRTISQNLKTALLDEEKMTDMLEKDLVLHRVARSDGCFPFICSPLGFVPKPGGKLRRIHHLSYPYKQSTNDGIQQEYGYLQYARVFDVCNAILLAGRGAWIMKRD